MKLEQIVDDGYMSVTSCHANKKSLKYGKIFGILFRVRPVNFVNLRHKACLISALSRLYTLMNWLSVRSACGDILTFVDTRWCALKVVARSFSAR